MFSICGWLFSYIFAIVVHFVLSYDLIICFDSVFRQCALTALNDVRQYLSVEGGQVAVSSWLLTLIYNLYTGLEKLLLKCISPQIAKYML